MFVEGAKIACASEQMWINDPMVERIVGLKPFQLHMARRCGLNIPQTIMTNGSRQLKDFVKVNKSSIIKTFYPVTWCNGDRFIMAYASRVTNLELVDLSAVALTSNLAQSYIEKEFELRIFYFDGEITSVRIHSQGSEKSEVDWRAQFDGTLEVEIYRDLPRDISTRIREFSSEVGLKYGAFDFIAGQDGKFYFLECNPSGQFLFLEDWNPSIRLTASFLKLLTNNMALSSKQRDKLDGFSLKDMMQDSDANIYYKNQTASWPVSIPASFNYEEVSSI